MNDKVKVIIQLLGTLVGAIIGFAVYFVGVVFGVVWSAGKTGFRDATVQKTIPTHTQRS